MNKQQVGARLLPDVIAWLDIEAAKRGMTRSSFAAYCIHRVWVSEKEKA